MLRNIVQLSTKCLRGLNIAKVTNTNSYIQVQLYSRFTARRHVAIANEVDLFDVPEDPQPVKEKVPSGRRKRRHSKKAVQSDVNVDGVSSSFRKEKRKPLPQDEPTNKYAHSKLYDNEKELSSLMIQIRSKKHRKKLNKIVLEGTRLIMDAIQARMIPEKIIFSEPAELLKLSLPKDTHTYKVTYRTIQLWSSLTTPSGIMGIFETPDVENFQSSNSLPITILCDNIRDPGNLGSILRAAAGVGCDKVILSKGCVDLWEPKVLRSAAGSHFRIPIISHKSWEEIKFMLSPYSKFIIADNRVGDGSCSPEFRFEATEIENEDSDKDKKKTFKRYNEGIDFSDKLDIVPYYSVDYTQGETVIIIGGETEGLSERSFQLANNSNGVRVNVPLNNGVESLNSGMALGIIAFEIKRQFLIAAKMPNN